MAKPCLEHRGSCGDGPVAKVLTVQTRGPQYEPQNPSKMLGGSSMILALKYVPWSRLGVVGGSKELEGPGGSLAS